MKVLERSVYRGPSVFAGRPMVRIMLDIGELEQYPSNTIPGFVEGLLAALPSLENHHCSLGRAGGFVERLRDGTWLGHVVEHVALELQTLAGHRASRGKTRAVAGRPGVYNLMYEYADGAVALAAGRLALELVASLLPRDLGALSGLELLGPPLPISPKDTTVAGMLRLAELATASSLGPTTASIVSAAQRRGIPWERVDERSLIRLGHGSRQRSVRASITDATSHLGVEAAGNKSTTKKLLAAAGLPVPAGSVVSTASEAVAAAIALGFPVVTKPLNGNHGRGVSIELVTLEDVERGFSTAAATGGPVIVERQLSGADHRILVINGRVVAAARRVPPTVTGDGSLTIAELVAQLNADPRRGVAHENVMTRVRPDEALIAEQGFTADSIPGPGRLVHLRRNANLSTGASAVDCTDDLHPSTRRIAERAARIIGLDVCGLDILTPDISRPLEGSGGGIVEVNAAPGYRMHISPSEGISRDVGGATVDMLYPPGSRSRIPIVSVTGTNGKSTTIRMIGHILQHHGRTVGLTSTSGVYIDGQLVKAVDASGPKSARMVLADPTVDAAVLETARGGILREGLAYDRADVGVVLNVSTDHLGLKGVHTLEDLARVKSVVARQVKRRGTTVLNADDPLTRRMAGLAGGSVAFFTMVARGGWDARLQQHISEGGVVASVDTSSGAEEFVVHAATGIERVLPVGDVPATLAGAARFNVANALAAILATRAVGVPLTVIADALRTFESNFAQNPGRMNITRAPGFTTIVDYAHNPAALRALQGLIETMRASHSRVIGVVSVPGDRRDEDIREIGGIAGEMFDELIFRELPDGRGRVAGGVISLLSDGAGAAGVDESHVRRIMDEHEAMDAALSMAGPDDLVVVMPTKVDAVWNQVMSFSRQPADSATSTHA